MGQIDHRAEVREFLSSRRARIAPEQAGCRPTAGIGASQDCAGRRWQCWPAFPSTTTSGWSANLSGASDSVLEALARTVRLDEAERDHLLVLARAVGRVATVGR
ncbi:MAG TPA: hypothetical protein VFR23_11800 [Jiangellaceae bacterium]|nr:hypothetical protein [Jiangellaceae bacterium]